MLHDKKTQSLAVAVVTLVAIAFWLHAAGSASAPAHLRTSLTPEAVAALRVDEQYRTDAAGPAPSYDVQTLAGSGAPGLRDGSGLFAQFLDPIDLTLSPDGRLLFVLDDGGRVLRRIDTRTRAVTTMPAADVAKVDPKLADGFLRIVATADGVFLLDRAHRVILMRDGRLQILTGGPVYTSDLLYSGGSLLVRSGGGEVYALEAGKWRVIARFASPAVLAGPHPDIVSAAYLMNALRPKTKTVSVIGSFGWGGNIVSTRITELLAGLKTQIKYLDPVLIKGLPMKDDFKALDRLAAEIDAANQEEPAIADLDERVSAPLI